MQVGSRPLTIAQVPYYHIEDRFCKSQSGDRQAMNWTIDYLEEDGIVYAKTSGTMDWDEHMRFAKETFSFAHKHCSHKILIDFLEMVPNFTILQIDDLPKVLKDYGIGPEHRIAALHDPSAPHCSENVFFKNVATIKSITVQYFTDKNEALNWLKSQP